MDFFDPLDETGVDDDFFRVDSSPFLLMGNLVAEDCFLPSFSLVIFWVFFSLVLDPERNSTFSFLPPKRNFSCAELLILVPL